MNNNENNRIIYLDVLRILATVAVIILHVAASNWYSVDISTIEWQFFNIVNSAVRWAVPIFVMISGTLFLDNEKNLDEKKLYSKNIRRIVIAFIFWSAIYAINRGIKGEGLTNVLTFFIKGHYHLWFLFMIVGLYMLVPLLRKITDSKKSTEYFLGLGGIFTFLVPRVIHLLECLEIPKFAIIVDAISVAFSNFKFNFTLGFVMYFVLGFYLYKYDINKTKKRLFYFWGIARIYCYSTSYYMAF